MIQSDCCVPAAHCVSAETVLQTFGLLDLLSVGAAGCLGLLPFVDFGTVTVRQAVSPPPDTRSVFIWQQGAKTDNLDESDKKHFFRYFFFAAIIIHDTRRLNSSQVCTGVREEALQALLDLLSPHSSHSCVHHHVSARLNHGCVERRRWLALSREM